MVYRITPTYYDTLFNFPFLLSRHYTARDHTDHHTSRHYTVQPSYTYRRAKEATYLEVELPGVAKEHVTVEVEDRKLIIKGRRFEHEPGKCCLKDKGKDCKEPLLNAKYLLVLPFSDSINADAVSADHCGNGVLVVTLPRKERQFRKVELGS